MSKKDTSNLDFSCETTHISKFVWKVKNFSKRPEQKGQKINSNTFTVFYQNKSTNWHLQLYPKGDSKAKPGYLSYFVIAEDLKAIASFTMSISDEHGNKTEIQRCNRKEFNPFSDSVGWGCRDAISMNNLKKWLSDDVLILVCEMFVVEPISEIKQNQVSQMMDDLVKAYIDKNSLDVTVTCGDASFECNKFMLTARSPVFKSMFQHEMKESQTNVVDIKDLEPKVLEDMLKYIHTGDAPKIKDLAKELLAAADLYQLNQLKNSCQEVLTETLDVENSIQILIISDMYSCQKLKKDALKFIIENIKSVVSSGGDWKKELESYPSLQSEIIEKMTDRGEDLLHKKNQKMKFFPFK